MLTLGGCGARKNGLSDRLLDNLPPAIGSGVDIHLRGTLPVQDNETIGANLVRQGDEWSDLLVAEFRCTNFDHTPNRKNEKSGALQSI
jgi:hypothetical protein